MRAATWLQVDRAVLANGDEAHLAATHRWFHRHGPHEAGVGLELSLADPALRHRMIGCNQLVEAGGECIPVD